MDGGAGRTGGQDGGPMLTAADRRPWIVTCRRGDGLRLICFPYAGGGPSLFRGWPLELSQQVEVCAVQLPGREARMKEPPIGDLRRLVVELADAIDVYKRQVRGRGLMIGVEIVDRDAPIELPGCHPSAPRLASRIQHEALRRGLILELGGRHNCVVRFLPPLIVTAEQIDTICLLYTSRCV